MHQWRPVVDSQITLLLILLEHFERWFLVDKKLNQRIQIHFVMYFVQCFIPGRSAIHLCRERLCHVVEIILYSFSLRWLRLPFWVKKCYSNDMQPVFECSICRVLHKEYSTVQYRTIQWKHYYLLLLS